MANVVDLTGELVVDLTNESQSTYYGSDIDDAVESDYGSDIDAECADRILTSTLTPRISSRLRPLADKRFLGGSICQDKSSFLTLPPELHNHIYEKLFEDFEAHLVFGQWYRPPAVLLTCKLVYDEATSVFYANATFVASSIKILERRLSSLRQRHRRLVSKIKLDSMVKSEGEWRRPRVASSEDANSAEDDLHAVRDLLCRQRWFGDGGLPSFEASLKLPDGRIAWSSDPVKTYEQCKARHPVSSTALEFCLVACIAEKSEQKYDSDLAQKILDFGLYLHRGFLQTLLPDW